MWYYTDMKIDKELKTKAGIIKAVIPSWSKRKFAFANRMLKRFFKGKAFIKDVNYKQEYVERVDGSKLRLCVYSPKGELNNEVGLLWLCGGGFAMGQPEQDALFFIRDFVKEFNCVVVSPEYTKSLDKPYPAAFQDCCLALSWLKEHSKQLSVDDGRLFVGGDSAGGGLTVAMCLYERDTQNVNVAFQMPLYPMLDDRENPSSKDNKAPVWNSKSNVLAWKLYLADCEDVPKYAAPARETNYSSLPPCLTYVGDVEPFYDETVRFVEELKKADVPVRFEIFEGCFHGFDIVGRNSKVGKRARRFLLDGFLYAKEHYRKEQE